MGNQNSQPKIHTAPNSVALLARRRSDCYTIEQEGDTHRILNLNIDWDDTFYNNSSALNDVEHRLSKAIRENNLNLLKEILETNPQIVERTDSKLSTLLHFATRYNQIDIVKYLVNVINVNSRDCDGNAPIHHAVVHDDGACLKILLENEADVNAQTNNRSTALIFATLDEYLENMKLLLSYKSDVNIQDSRGVTALHTAATHEYNANMTALLLKHGANVNIQDKFGQTPLHVAAILYSTLVSKVDKIDRISIRASSRSPSVSQLHNDLHLVKIICMLVEIETVKLNLADNEGKTVLHYAASGPTLSFATELFLQHGAEVNSQDNCGRTPLHLAINLENMQSITALLGANADVYICDHMGVSVLKLALDKNLDISSHVLTSIAGLNVTDKANFKLVEDAVKKNVPGILVCLIGRDKRSESRQHVEINEVTTEYLEARLDACIDKKDRNIYIDFTPLLLSEFRVLETIFLIFLAISANNKFVHLLLHPTVRTFLKWKWKHVSLFFLINLGFFISICLNIWLYKYFFYLTDEMNFLGYILYVCLFLHFGIFLLSEVFQLKTDWREYVSNIENWIEVFFIIYIIVLLSTYSVNINVRFQISAIGNIFIAATLILIVGHHPIAASAVHLLRTVSYKFLRYFIIYIAIIIAFSCSFYELKVLPFTKNTNDSSNNGGQENDVNNSASNSSDGSSSFLELHSTSFLQTIGMFNGELNLKDLLSAHSSYVVIITMMLFIIFVSIIILNLLNGLALSNILEKNDLKISKNKAWLKYLYNLDRSITFLGNIKIVKRFISNRPSPIFSCIFILPDYIRYKDLNLKSKDENHCYLYSNSIHKDAYEIYEQRQFYKNSNHSVSETSRTNLNEDLIFQNNELQQKNVILMQELKISREEFREITQQLFEMNKLLSKLISVNENIK